MITVADALRTIMEEYYSAVKEHPPLKSASDGYRAIYRKLDDLKSAIYCAKPNGKEILKEAKQAGASILRLMIDVCGEEGEDAKK